MQKLKAKQRVLDSMKDKNIVLESIITFEKKKPVSRKVTLTLAEQSKLRALAKKDANAFNKYVTQNVTAKLALDSKSEKDQLCANAHPKMIQARVARLLNVEANIAKTNYYLRMTSKKETKKINKKTIVKK